MSIADALQAAGVTQIVGDVVGDGSRYDDEFVVPSWGPEHVLGAEAGPYDALMVNDGRTFADSTIGFNPNQSAARQFIRLLQARNIAVTGRSRNGAAPTDGSVTVLGGVDSAPLADVVDELLQTSDNNTAELLLKEIGVAVRGEGTRVAGLQEVWNTLGRVAGPARRRRARRRLGAQPQRSSDVRRDRGGARTRRVSTASWRPRSRSRVCRARSSVNWSAGPPMGGCRRRPAR